VRWSRTTGGFRPLAIVTGLVFVLAGLMFAAAATTSQGTDLRTQRATELRDLVHERAQEVAALDAQVADRRRTVDDLTAGRAGDPRVAPLVAQTARLATDVGLTEVRGPGLKVTLDDAPARDPSDPLWQAISPNDVIVHQSDVQAVVNALWRGGATAMEIMDQRIVATSAIRCVGNTLLLQGRVYSPPFVISATGPVRQMRAALRADPTVAGYRDWAQVVGLGYDVRRVTKLAVPAYGGPLTMDYAAPVTPNASTPTPSPTPTRVDPALPAQSSQPSQ
jgi:uncharacterized protein YlxW (UPF0749 family)